MLNGKLHFLWNGSYSLENQWATAFAMLSYVFLLKLIFILVKLTFSDYSQRILKFEDWIIHEFKDYIEKERNALTVQCKKYETGRRKLKGKKIINTSADNCRVVHNY